MFFSQLRLRPDAAQSPEYWTFFKDINQIHKSVWKLFPSHENQPRDFLYRLDVQKSATILHIVSARKPEDLRGFWDIFTKPYEPTLRKGDMMAFRLRVNPTRKSHGKRYDVVMGAKHKMRQNNIPKAKQPAHDEIVQTTCKDWLDAKGSAHGFQLHAISAENYHPNQRDRSRGICLTTCDLDGLLIVQDPAVLRKTLFHGVGPAKSFGCGLMMVKKA